MTDLESKVIGRQGTYLLIIRYSTVQYVQSSTAPFEDWHTGWPPFAQWQFLRPPRPCGFRWNRMAVFKSNERENYGQEGEYWP